MKPILALLLLAVSFLAPLARAAAPAEEAGSLGPPYRDLRGVVVESEHQRRRRYAELERLRKDLRYIAEVLDRETIGAKKDLSGYSEGGLRRLAEIRASGGVDAKLLPVLQRLEKLYTELPAKDYAAEYSRSLMLAVAEELRWAAQEAKTETELLALLKDHLVLPQKPVADEDAFESLAWFPTDVPLEKFKKFGAIRNFLVKHRIKRPKSHTVMTAPELVAGGYNVQIGADITGVVTGVYNAFDQDYCFDIGHLHLEISPEWRLMHPKMIKPKVGDRVRVKGWTYFDVFHKAEYDYAPEDPVMGVNRVTQWEVHPVQDVELLP
ncbi:MAG: hypothetical protein AAB320_00280 [Elusimicrobiota bacterium]|mgnify:FL=1